MRHLRTPLLLLFCSAGWLVGGCAAPASTAANPTSGVAAEFANRPIGPAPVVLSAGALPADDLELVATVLRRLLAQAPKDEPAFVGFHVEGGAWSDPPSELLAALRDAPVAVRPVSAARLPRRNEMESAMRFRGVEDPATGRRGAVYFVTIQRRLADGGVEVMYGSYGGPLAGGGGRDVMERVNGRWAARRGSTGPASSSEAWRS